MSQTESKAIPAPATRERSGYPTDLRRDSVAAWRGSGLSASKYSPYLGGIPRRCTLGSFKRTVHDREPGGCAPPDPGTLETMEVQLRAELKRNRHPAPHPDQRDEERLFIRGVLCDPRGCPRGFYRHLARQQQAGPCRQRDSVLAALIKEEFAKATAPTEAPRRHRAPHGR
jgi:hypothetical protein